LTVRQKAAVATLCTLWGEHQAVLGCLAKWPHSFLGCAEQKQSEKIRLFLLSIAAKNYKWKEAKILFFIFLLPEAKCKQNRSCFASLHFEAKQFLKQNLCIGGVSR
jgi:hypothetical protein